MTQSIKMSFLAAVAAFAMTACSTDDLGQPASETEQAVTQICTPGDQMCDFGCGYGGAPSSSDCIIRCNAAGTRWVHLYDCGWAQNGQTSASCLDAEPYPLCQNN